jgi:hypothetical protein
MNDQALEGLYRKLLAHSRQGGRGACPAPEALRAVIERTLATDRRLDIMEHVAECLPCQRDLALLAQVAGTRPSRGGIVTRWWIAAAASVVMAVAGGRALSTRGRGDAVVRGETSAVELAAPVGEVARASAGDLVWHPVRGATRFEVEILDGTGAVVYTATTRDTTAPMPDVVRPEAQYRWRVSAVRRDGTRVESAVRSFTLR